MPFVKCGDLTPRILSIVLALVFLSVECLSPAIAQSPKIQFNTRSQILLEDEIGRNYWQFVYHKEIIPTSKIAIIICDMWDKHWSRGAAERINEMAPIMNTVVNAARAKGIQIIHAPTSCMGFYKNTPARQRIIAAQAVNAYGRRNYKLRDKGYKDSRNCNIRSIKRKTNGIIETGKPGYNLNPYLPLPFYCPDGGSDTNHGNELVKAVWTRQHPAIEIDHEKDVISSDGNEIYNFLSQKKIKNVVIMGVHTNMCILHQPFGIMEMIKRGMHIVLVRDLTDAMYNPGEPPYVSHEEGTKLVIGFIEKFHCPTIVSSDLIKD